MAKVSHIIKTGLKHGVNYRVFVTQVNEKGLESPKSDPVVIRVGDILPPPVPILAMNERIGAKGFVANRGRVDVHTEWTVSVADDLDKYVLYTWKKWPTTWGSDGIKDATFSASATSTTVLTNTTTGYNIAGQDDKTYLYVGIQAVDYSGNASDIYVKKLYVEDTSVLLPPVSAPSVSAGVWQLKVVVAFPVSASIEKVAIYRDESTSPQGYMFFRSGMTGSYIDALEVMDGLEHSYRYTWIDRNGKESDKSPKSSIVKAKTIDMTLLDKASIEAQNKIWLSDFVSSGGITDLDQLKKDVLTQAKNTEEMAKQIELTRESFKGVYKDYTLLAEQFNQISAKVSGYDGKIQTMESSISQNASDITSRVTRTELDESKTRIIESTRTMISQTDDKIMLMASILNGEKPGVQFSSINVLNNAIQLKVNKNEVISAINITPEVIQLDGKRIHITGDTLFDNNVNIRGVLNAEDIYRAGYKLKEVSVWSALVWDGTYLPTSLAGYNTVIYGIQKTDDNYLSDFSINSNNKVNARKYIQIKDGVIITEPTNALIWCMASR